jgi:flagellar biosynthesis protein FliR
MWPLLRISAMVAAAPIFSTSFIPVRFRILLAVVLSIVIAPVIPPVPVIDILSPVGIATTVQQVLIGLAMGFILQMVFAAFVLAGQVTAMTMGLGFASLNDPVTGVVVPTVGQFYTIMVTLAFLAMNGHLVFIEVVVESFHTMPIGPTGLLAQDFWTIANWANEMFAGAVLVAIPALTAMLIVNIGFGVMTRSAPQLNIFVVGFPIIMTLGFIVIYITLPSALEELGRISNETISMLRQLLSGGR